MIKKHKLFNLPIIHHLFGKESYYNGIYLYRQYLEFGDISEPSVILDSGAAYGALFSAVDRNEHLLIGLDVNENMIRNMFKRRRRDKEIVIKGSCLNLPFCDSSIDLVIDNYCLIHNKREYKKGLEEYYRVLKRGGKLILTPGIDCFKEYLLYRF